jgi:hypothetical protein
MIASDTLDWRQYGCQYACAHSNVALLQVVLLLCSDGAGEGGGMDCMR